MGAGATAGRKQGGEERERDEAGRHRAGRRLRRSGAGAIALALAGALLGGCTPRPLLARAIRARGGPITTLVRTATARVELEFPGTWVWRTVFRPPVLFAWSIETTGEPNHYLFDGAAVRAFVGGGAVAVDTDPAAPLRLHARLVSATMLDALALPGVAVRELAPSELPPGAAAGLEARWPDGPDAVRVAFDARLLVTGATGPSRLPLVRAGTLAVAFDDFRRTGRWLVPWGATYRLDGVPIARETASAVCIDAPIVPPEAFATPLGLPDCGATRWGGALESGPRDH